MGAVTLPAGQTRRAGGVTLPAGQTHRAPDSATKTTPPWPGSLRVEVVTILLDCRQGSGVSVQNTYGSEAFLHKKKLELKILKHFHADLTSKLVPTHKTQLKFSTKKNQLVYQNCSFILKKKYWKDSNKNFFNES